MSVLKSRVSICIRMVHVELVLFCAYPLATFSSTDIKETWLKSKGNLVKYLTSNCHTQYMEMPPDDHV
jgi:hypothetical protein